MTDIDQLIQCDGCREWGILGDEVDIYDLSDDSSFSQVPLCLSCGPEENYENLA